MIIAETYLRSEVMQGIIAVAVAMLTSAQAHGGGNIEYVRGVLDTTRAQAINYGVSWHEMSAQIRGELEVDNVGIVGLLEG